MFRHGGPTISGSGISNQSKRQLFHLDVKIAMSSLKIPKAAIISDSTADSIYLGRNR